MSLKPFQVKIKTLENQQPKNFVCQLKSKIVYGIVYFYYIVNIVKNYTIQEEINIFITFIKTYTLKYHQILRLLINIIC